MAKQQIHLICNAHLDPVWLWEWQEGAAEAISTFRTAAELCEKHNAFVFNHNEVILYKWVQEYEPQLFERIRKLVKQGRWHIMGGWYLQPDCNMPCGESFIRQIQFGKNYFKQHFGAEPKTAINFDPFGHTQGLVQILAKSGHDSYLFGRPTPPWQDLPAEEFTWVGLDGSKVMATRFCGWYQTFLGKAVQIITERIEANKHRDILAVLWGVGNHGGGPSKYDLAQVEKLIAQSDKYDIRHSTPEIYFKALAKKKDSLPEFAGNLYQWGPGCYTSQIRIKQGHRKLENELYSTEKMLTAAYVNGLIDYPSEELAQAIEKLLFIEFHDILPGTSIAKVEDYALGIIGAGLDAAAKLKMRAFFNLASGQKKAKDGFIPVMAYNPHPFDTEQIVECEFNLHDFCERDEYCDIEVYSGGKKVCSQVEYEASSICKQWRKHVVMKTLLKPGMNRFDCLAVRKEAPKPKQILKNGKFTFKNDSLEIGISAATGLIDTLKIKGKEYLGKNGIGFDVTADTPDPWVSCGKNLGPTEGAFKLATDEQCAKFSGVQAASMPPVRVIEEGDVRTIIEACLTYQNSFMFVRYNIPKQGTQLQINIRVNWNENDKALKMSVEPAFDTDRILGDTAFGCTPLVTDGREYVSQKWTAALSDKQDMMLSCINNGTYGGDFHNRAMRITMLRSACYSVLADEQNGISKCYMPQDRLMPRFDNGVREFCFWLDGDNVENGMANIHSQALLKNEEPLCMSFFPNGDGKKPLPIAEISNSRIQISAVKKCDKGAGIVVRLYEPIGKPAKATLKLPAIKKQYRLAFSPFEVKTLVINTKTGACNEASMLEGKL